MINMNRIINSLITELTIKKIIDKMDKIYFTNMILGEMNLKYSTDEKDESREIAYLFDAIGNYAEKNLNEDKTSFINKISAMITPLPSVVNRDFHNFKDKRKAFSNFYKKSIDSYYIKYDRIKLNDEWSVKTKFGKIDISINLSKPEKSQKAIAKMGNMKSTGYPKCVLCQENIGYFGDNKISSKQNIRYVHDELANKNVFMHYSPYGYYNEHLIVNNINHVNMKISNLTIKQLLDFVEKYPFYFLGSNSDIPIVGGSILSHQHYQGGGGEFPIFKVKSTESFKSKNVKVEILNWPLSTIKLTSSSKTEIETLANKFIDAWYKYENKDLNIISKHNGKRQNGITPLAKFNNGKLELYLMLRNNGTSKEFPNGIFHVKEDVFNIKKENIGIIEAAGKAILPARLEHELQAVATALKENKNTLPKNMSHHLEWFKTLKEKAPKKDFLEFVKNECGISFAKGLSDCGVFYQRDYEFVKFVKGII